VNYSRSGSPIDRLAPSSEATLFAFRFQFPSAFTGRPTNGSLWKITPHRPQFSDFILWIFQSLLRSESTRLNSSHRTISYAVFCLKKKKKKTIVVYNYKT